jgi:Zn-dependent oligopeptidase
MVQVIERAASNPNIDVEKMERLLAMQERIMAQNAKVAFNEAMRAAQAEMPKIRRNKENTQTSSMYADLEQITDKAVPVYTRHGFSLSYGTADCPTPGHARITCVCAHVQGFERTYQADVPLDLTGLKGNQNKTATHGFGSTMSYGRRYLVCLIFNIALTNEDQDGNQPSDCITEEQVANLTALMTEVKASKELFLKFLRVESLDKLPAKKYSAAVKALEAKRNQ